MPTTKIILPSPDSLPRRDTRNTPITSPQVNGGHHDAEEPEIKRAKISLKLKRPAGDEVGLVSEHDVVEVAEIKTEPVDGRGLSKAVREALSTVIRE